MTVRARARSRRPSSRRRLVDATRTWDDDFADALAEQVRRGAGRRCSGALRRRRSRRRTRRTSPPRRRSPTCAASRRCSRRATSTWRCTSTSRVRGRASAVSSSTDVGEAVSLSPGPAAAARDLGVEVVDERPYGIVERAGRPNAWIYDFGLRYRPSAPVAGRTPRQGQVPGRLRRGLARRGREDGFNALVLRAGLDLAAGHRAARLREVPAPGRLDLQPVLHRGVPDLERAHRAAAGRAVRDAVRPRLRVDGERGGRAGRAGGDHRRPRRRRQPRPGPHPALTARA